MQRNPFFRMQTWAWVVLLVCASVIWRGPALADSSKIAADLLNALSRPAPVAMGRLQGAPQGTHRVIIQTKGKPSSALTGVLVGSFGGRTRKVFRNMDAFVADLPAAAIQRLSDNANVLRISPDRPVAACFDYGAESVGGDAAAVSSFAADGTGVGIALIDSGIAPHPDIPSAQIAAWKDFVAGAPSPYDDCGHGTHVAGILIGNGKSSSGAGYTKTFRGVAPKAKLVVAKVLGADGSGYASDVISAIDWVISIASAQHVRVMNLSLGYAPQESYRTDPLCQAVERAVAANIVVVVSAGNMGPEYGTIKSPGMDPNVITVGATRTCETPLRSDDEIFFFSSRGPTRYDYLAKPDIVAPGNNVISLRAAGSFLDVNYPENRVATTSYSLSPIPAEPKYFVMSGTSAAAPFVAGAAALLLQKSPKLSPNAVKAILMYSASKLGGPDLLFADADPGEYDVLTVGSGYLNIPGALAVNKNIDAGKAIGQYWLRSSFLAGSNLIGPEPVFWSQTVQWGSYSITGDILAYNDYNWHNTLWGSNVTWLGKVKYGDDQVLALSRKWQTCWAEDPDENSDAQVYGDNAIWGGRGF